MNELFLKIVNMSISASWLILAVLIIRVLSKKSPKWMRVALWGIVALRLLFPFSIESALSLIPSAETIPSGIELDATPAINSGIPVVNSVVNPILEQTSAPQPIASANPLQIQIFILSNIWMDGIIILLLYMLISCFQLQRKVCTAILLKENIYVDDKIDSPFVFGFVKPRIYLPVHINEQELEHVIAHEKAHIRRKDHWWKLLGFLVVTIHWFNPLVWLSYCLLCKDMELACDEKVIKTFSNHQRADYAQALFTCSVNRNRIAVCPVAFGEVSVKERVKSVMNYRKPAFWLIVLSVIICMVVAVCFLTSPVTQNEGSGTLNDVTKSDSGVRKWFDFENTVEAIGWEDKISIEVPEFPGVTFYYSDGEFISSVNTGADMDTATTLITGWPIWNAYFCDLTGDGLPEICTSLAFGSGFIDDRIVVYDYANGVKYELEDRGNYNYTLRQDSENGFLYIDKTEGSKVGLLASSQMNPDIGLVATGRLRIVDGQIQDVSNENASSGTESAAIVKTFEETPVALIESAYNNGQEVTSKRYYMMNDGTWRTDIHSYKYKLVVKGRLNNSTTDVTYIILSNIENISFEQAWKASGLSSNLNDYFNEEETVIVAKKFERSQENANTP